MDLKICWLSDVGFVFGWELSVLWVEGRASWDWIFPLYFRDRIKIILILGLVGLGALVDELWLSIASDRYASVDPPHFYVLVMQG